MRKLYRVNTPLSGLIYSLVVLGLFAGLVFIVVSCASTPQKTSNSEIITAIKAGDFRSVETLLGQGSDPNMQDSFGQPAITLVTQAPVTSSIHATTRRGEARYIQKHKNHAEIVRLLVAHGAKVNVKDHDGWTPLLQAEDSEERELVDFLKEAGATQ